MTPARLHPGAAIWHLRRFGVFEHSDHDQLEAVARVLRIREYKRRDAVFLPGDEPTRVYFLLTGRVKVSRVDPDTGKELILFIVRPGEPFGLLARASDGNAGTTAVALQHSRVGYIQRDDFDRLSQSESVAPELSRLIRERFATVATRLEDIAFRDVGSRLARLLLRLANDFPANVEGRRAIGVRLTQQDLADLIGATRERTNKTLSEFRRRGLIDSRRRTLRILDSPRLEKVAAFRRAN
jgi:CRP/FNR family transcriptional regulator